MALYGEWTEQEAQAIAQALLGATQAPDRATRLAQSTLALCAEPSETGDEGRLGAGLALWARQALPEAEVTEAHGSVIVRRRGAPGAPLLGLFGHTDTVKADAAQPVAIEGGKLYGCGASDMKAGLAVMMELLAHGPRDGTELLAVFYAAEEGPAANNALGPILADGLLPPMAAAVALEPTDGRVEVGCLGGLHARVRVRGQRAHSARPWQGKNALHAAGALLSRLGALAPREVALGEGLVYREVLSATTAATFNSRNVVPDLFELNLNLRYAPSTSEAEAEAWLREVVGSEGEVEVIDRAPAGLACHDDPAFQAWRASRGLVLAPKQAWTDVARLTGIGVPAINLGPGATAQAHQAGEWVELAAIERACEDLAALVAMLPACLAK